MTAGVVPDGLERAERPFPITAHPRRRAPVPEWFADVAGSAMWLSLLVVTALWVANGGVQNLSGAANALTSLGRLTGLLSPPTCCSSRSC